MSFEALAQRNLKTSRVWLAKENFGGCWMQSEKRPPPARAARPAISGVAMLVASIAWNPLPRLAEMMFTPGPTKSRPTGSSERKERWLEEGSATTSCLLQAPTEGASGGSEARVKRVPHSQRSDDIGSTRVARRAGK